MAKLITKFKYLKPSARQSVGGYAKYIATREGVEKVDDTFKTDPSTEKQKKLIERILRDFPDSNSMLEYEDYLKEPTLGNASEFITRALEDNANEALNTKTYADYIATRPRAERFGSHGLFTDDGVRVKLEDVSRELNEYEGNVWTVIISLRREDAERLGFNSGERWRDMLRTQTETIAKNFKIPVEDLKWYAAFHNESHHPHVHLTVIRSRPRVMPMKVLKIKDNTQVKKDALSDIDILTGKIADKTLEQLEREGVFVFPEFVVDAEDITKDQMILQSINDTYHSGNVMGFLGCGDERLIIESRFCGDDEDYFFQYLLDRVLDFPNIVNLESDADQNNRLFNFLLFLFPYYLKTAMRKGLFKKYVRNRYNDGNVKGTIDIARHIEQNTPFTGNVAYSQREFSYDNNLMELVRHTIEFIKGKPYGNNLLIRVKDEVKLVIEATPRYEQYDRQKIVEANKKNAVRHAYFREYLALQRLCLLILQHQKHQIGSGSRQIYGILFDGAWLWEEYVSSLIDDVFFHPMNKGGTGAQRLFDGNVGLIYPDFISRDHETRIIADAKYKPIDNIGNKDYLQVLAYMFRFDAKAGYYLYPEAAGTADRRLWMNKGSTYEANVAPRDDICLTKHGLKIPVDAENYEMFVFQMKVSEAEFRQVFAAR